MPDEFSLIANRCLERLAHGEMLVPSLFWYELANVLIVNERRGRTDGERAAQAIERIRTLRIRTDDSDADLSSAMDLARAHRLTVYDASYLELARRYGAALATLDLRLQAAATAEGVELVTDAG